MNRALILPLCLLMLWGCGRKTAPTPTDTAQTAEEQSADTLPRTSITFIMGEDRSLSNPYYSLADHYYRLSADDRTDRVVDSLTSLREVLKYLNENPAPDSLPYGTVNLVCHGNGFVDLQPTVTRNGQRISVASLRKALADSLLPCPDTAVIDSRTLIHLHGCGVGNNRPLLNALAEAFGGKARVVASKLFECYTYTSPSRNPQGIRHYYARAWYAFHHPDSQPSTAQLALQLRRRYPHDTINWNAALHRTRQQNPSQTYHFSYIVPCRYEEIYGSPSELPPLNSAKQRAQWEAGNKDFGELLASTGIERQYFRARFYRQQYIVDDSLLWGIKVKAHAAVVCVLQPLTETDSAGHPYQPVRPPLTDTAIFSYSH